MAIDAIVRPYTLDFKFAAGTSRGVLNQKRTYFIKVWDDHAPDVYGIGECGPLAKLSIDDLENYEDVITEKLKELRSQPVPGHEEAVYDLACKVAGDQWPALCFAIETALLDLMHGGKRMIFDTPFYHSQKPMPINGLVWMGHMEAMLLQISDKVAAGFDCIKMKVGSLDFEKEVDILQYIRRKYYDKQIMLRVDANGAFKAEEALYKLNAIARYDIHSIEQPVKAGQPGLMAELCQKSPVPIALDEELIGIRPSERRSLLETIKPQYIILKPTLVGGLRATREWIMLAEELGIGWWMTSALESNIGLNAICQLTGQLGAKGYQGLGTGQLYHNNIDSPLTIQAGTIYYDQSKPWQLPDLLT